MSCPRYRELLSRYLDDALSQRERQDLLAHIGDCPQCAATLARYRQATVVIERLPESAPSPHVREAVLAETAKRGARGPWRIALVAAAASVILAVGAFAAAGRPLTGGPGDPALTSAATPGVKQSQTGGDGLEVIDALRRSLGPAEEPALPRYLPQGAKVERVSLGRPPQAGGPYEVDLDLRLEDGKSLLVRQRAKELRSAGPTPAARTVVIDGREWRYLPKNAAGAREPVTHVLTGEVDGRRYELESSLPLDDLIRVAESIR